MVPLSATCSNSNSLSDIGIQIPNNQTPHNTESEEQKKTRMARRGYTAT